MNMLPGHQMAVETELLLFFGSLAAGLPAGILLDVFRTLRVLIPHCAVVVFIEDTVFSFLSVCAVQCYVWMFAGGTFRWHYALGAMTGLLLYLLTVGAVWMRLVRGLRRVLTAAVRKIRKST